jgi:Tol biopolymer transport system component
MVTPIISSGERYVTGRSAIALVPLSAAPAAERRARVVTSDAWKRLWQATLSPDDRWIAFVAAPRADSSIATVYLVRRSGGEWIQVTPGIDWEDKPLWAPEGRTIYFVSSPGVS